MLDVTEKNIYRSHKLLWLAKRMPESISTYQLSVTQVIDTLCHSGGFRLLQVSVYRQELVEWKLQAILPGARLSVQQVTLAQWRLPFLFSVVLACLPPFWGQLFVSRYCRDGDHPVSDRRRNEWKSHLGPRTAMITIKHRLTHWNNELTVSSFFPANCPGVWKLILRYVKSPSSLLLAFFMVLMWKGTANPWTGKITVWALRSTKIWNLHKSAAFEKGSKIEAHPQSINLRW